MSELNPIATPRTDATRPCDLPDLSCQLERELVQAADVIKWYKSHCDQLDMKMQRIAKQRDDWAECARRNARVVDTAKETLEDAMNRLGASNASNASYEMEIRELRAQLSEIQVIYKSLFSAAHDMVLSLESFDCETQLAAEDSLRLELDRAKKPS